MASNYAYYPNGTVSDVYIGAGLYNGSQTAALHQNTTINSRLQVTGRTATSLVSGSTNILSLGFNYPSSPKNNGNLTTQSITTDGGFGASGLSATQYYGYDPFNRLTTMSESSTSGCPNGSVLCQTFGYDAYGNRAVTAGYTPSPTLTPTATSQFTGNRWLGSGSTTASYDAAGNQINTNGAGNAFTYDAENRMISANIANMGATTYAYDGDGRRVQKVSSTFTSYYVYDAGGSEIAEYTTGPQPNYGTLYVTADHLGSTRMVTDGNGNVVRRYDYLPFGEEIPAGSYSRGADYGGNSYPNVGGTSFPGDAAANKFTGKERDWETGLDYFGARYFSGSQGRFTGADRSESPEPVPYAKLDDPQSLNLFSYLRNNPLYRIDPDGHGECESRAGGSTNAWLRCKGVATTITSSDDSAVIGPLRKTPGTQVGERLSGAVKGTIASFLYAGDTLVGGHGNTEGAKLADKLAPTTQDERFGGQVADIIGILTFKLDKEYLLLKKALQSDGALAEVMAGLGKRIAGAGTETVLRDAERLAAQYGGKAEDWAKVTSRGASPQIHASQNVVTGQVVEPKTVIKP